MYREKTRLRRIAPRGAATTTHASTTGIKLTYTLAGDSSPVTPLGARPRNPNLTIAIPPPRGAQ